MLPHDATDAIAAVAEIGAERRRRRRPPWPAWVYAALVALYLVPFWAVPGYLPSTDGPSHVYNAWLLGELAGPAPARLLRAYYTINPQPVPNSLTHLALAALLWALPPAAAEKALLSAYVLLLAGALWYLAGAVDRERAWLALLGLPFAWNMLLGYGFYNFLFSVPLLLLALGLWWRHRDRPGPGFAAALVGLLLACYFAHILAAVLALAGIGVLWLASWRRERWRGHLVHLAILAPAAVLPVWFTMVRPGGPGYPSDASWQTLWSDLAHLRTLWQFSGERGETGAILAKVFAAWVAFTLTRAAMARRRPGTTGSPGAEPPLPSLWAWVRSSPAPPSGLGPTPKGREGEGPPPRNRWWWWREEDAFLVLALLLAGLYFLSPGGTAGGGFLQPRLLLYPFLVVLPWLSTDVGRWGRAAAVVALAALAAYPVTWAVPCYRAGARDVEAFVHGLDAVPPGSVVVPLVFDRHTTSCMRSGSVDHAAGYAAVAKGLVDWDNYEAQTDLFPVRFRAWAVRPTRLGVENDPLHLRVHELRSRVDYIYCWRMPPGAPVAGGLARQCTLVAASDQWRLYATQPPPEARSGSSKASPAAYSP
ncbi:MAG TPA: hypothetical protein VHB47_21480 [Thermoanaerobaculia bacterium]|jgi:hypothetical protein|nr:hypothetical protein [Thermoanaerobaculia bacterium]